MFQVYSEYRASLAFDLVSSRQKNVSESLLIWMYQRLFWHQLHLVNYFLANSCVLEKEMVSPIAYISLSYVISYVEVIETLFSPYCLLYIYCYVWIFNVVLLKRVLFIFINQICVCVLGIHRLQWQCVEEDGFHSTSSCSTGNPLLSTSHFWICHSAYRTKICLHQGQNRKNLYSNSASL